MKRKTGLFSFLRRSEEKSSPNVKKTYYAANYGDGQRNGIAQKRLWKEGSYGTMARDGFMDNIIVNRSLSMIAKNAASVSLLYYAVGPDGVKVELPPFHPLVKLIGRPNNRLSQVQFFENLFSYFSIAGNAYVYAVVTENGVESIDLLRPDRVVVSPFPDGDGAVYEYSIDSKTYNISIDYNSPRSPLLHLRGFHPLDDYYGFSGLEAAIDVVEQYNECIKWNRSLIKNGARPSGAIVVRSDNGNGGSLTDEQFEQIRSQLNNYTGQDNAGKILILEGGLDWREMSVSPKDMEFLETKNGAARDIALALGVPPQLLGIKGDNTYSNVSEARLAFWEETVIPLLNLTLDAMSKWLSGLYGMEIEISYDLDSISALSERRGQVWANVKDSDFVTAEEKREMLGFGDLEGSAASGQGSAPFAANAVDASFAGSSVAPSVGLSNSGPNNSTVGGVDSVVMPKAGVSSLSK